MKLSDAMVLGASAFGLQPGSWCNCALGVAYRAAKEDKVPRSLVIEFEWPWLNASPSGELRAAVSQLPVVQPASLAAYGNERWALSSNLYAISYLFEVPVQDGRMTFEDLVSLIHRIEPECGACNQVQCTCQRVTAITWYRTQDEVVLDTVSV